MTIEQLRTTIPGRVMAPGDDGWDAARLFHSGIGEPAAIVRAGSVGDVAAAVEWAAADGVPVMVRSGGHSAWGSVPGGLTIDLHDIADIDVDGTRVRVGGGAVWGAVAEVLADADLGISSGDTSSVGVGGLTLGGGIGWMVRAWGLAADQLVGAQVVTATGEVVETSASSHPDLFWALRGGGGNFGVVTRFEFEAHPLPEIVFAELQVAGDSRPVLRALRDLMPSAPRELTVTFMDAPAMDPSAPAGASVSACWIGGDVETARAALAPLLALDQITETDISARRYADVLLEMPDFDPEQPMPGFIGGNTLLVEAGDDVLDALVAFREANSASVLFLRSLGGAYGDIGQGSTPFPARDASWFAMAGAFDLPGLVDDAGRVAIQGAWDEIEARGAGVYGNFSTSTDPAFVEKMYAPEAADRLARIKREWDPGNVFSRTHNIAPA